VARLTNLGRLRRICLALPEAIEQETWGEPTMRVRSKIFCFPREHGMTVKADPGERAALLADARFSPAPYLARAGWVSMALGRSVEWDEVDELVRTSYVLIAPKRLGRLVVEAVGGSA
jgi:predicted DNA-binding protein (MmcQ/YjbR family)